MTSSEIFERGTLCWEKYRRMEEQKLWPGLALNPEFARGKGLKPIVKK